MLAGIHICPASLHQVLSPLEGLQVWNFRLSEEYVLRAQGFVGLCVCEGSWAAVQTSRVWRIRASGSRFAPLTSGPDVSPRSLSLPPSFCCDCASLSANTSRHAGFLMKVPSIWQSSIWDAWLRSASRDPALIARSRSAPLATPVVC